MKEIQKSLGARGNHSAQVAIFLVDHVESSRSSNVDYDDGQLGGPVNGEGVGDSVGADLFRAWVGNGEIKASAVSEAKQLLVRSYRPFDELDLCRWANGTVAKRGRAVPRALQKDLGVINEAIGIDECIVGNTASPKDSHSTS